jgi:hypothetical protein
VVDDPHVVWAHAGAAHVTPYDADTDPTASPERSTTLRLSACTAGAPLKTTSGETASADVAGAIVDGAALALAEETCDAPDGEPPWPQPAMTPAAMSSPSHAVPFGRFAPVISSP